jgi:addiction module HigA family antidote
MPREIPLSHPGEILLEDWLKPMGISQYALAKAIGVSPRRINEIVHGVRGITADTALRLAAFFGTDAQSWLNLQTHYDTEIARESIKSVLARIHRFDAIQSTEKRRLTITPK